MRMKYITDTQRQGEVDVGECKHGDRVKFLGDFDKPGWPRVDAGTMGVVRGVKPGSDTLVVECSASKRSGGVDEFKRYSFDVPADVVALMLNSDDPRGS